MSLLASITKAVASLVAATDEKLAEEQTSASVLSIAQEVELSVINKLLEPTGAAFDTVVFQAAQLDRATAEKTAQEEMSAAISKNDTEVIAEAARLIHESSRVRRDVNIAKASHKQLLLGSYKTLYQRKLQLEKNLQEGIYA